MIEIPEGWIPHAAGPCPVPLDSKPAIMAADGRITETGLWEARWWGGTMYPGVVTDWWLHESDDPTAHIIAYKPDQDYGVELKFDIKPCPFCGGEGHLFTVSLPLMADCTDIMVACDECDSIGPPVMFDEDHYGELDIPRLEEEAIAKWNKRA